MPGTMVNIGDTFDINMPLEAVMNLETSYTYAT